MEIYRLLLAVAALAAGVYLARRADFPGLTPLQRFAFAVSGVGGVYLLIGLTGLHTVAWDLTTPYPEPGQNTFVDILKTVIVLGCVGAAVWILGTRGSEERIDG